MAIEANFPKTPKSGKVAIANGDASNLKTLATAGANGTKIVSVIASSSDTSARDVTIGISRSGTFYPLGTKSVPITAGQVTGTPAVNMLDPSVVVGLGFDADSQPYIFLESGDTLDLKSLTTVTSGKTIGLSATGADF